MSDGPPDGTADVTEWLWRNQNTRRHLGIWIAGILVALSGSIVLVVAAATGIYISPTVYPLWRGTFDYVNGVLVTLTALVLIRLGVSDEHHYQFRLIERLPRSKISDILIPVSYVTIAIVWGTFVLWPVLRARTTDPTYLAHQAGGTPALEAGVLIVMITYYAVLAIVFVLYLIGLRYNPVDLDDFDLMVRRLLPSRRTSNSS